MMLVFLILALLALDVAALRWGADTLDGDGSEWERRRAWRGRW